MSSNLLNNIKNSLEAKRPTDGEIVLLFMQCKRLSNYLETIYVDVYRNKIILAVLRFMKLNSIVITIDSNVLKA